MISSFYTRVPKIIILCYTVPEIWRVTDVIFHFGLFFALLPPSNNLETQKFEKMKKKTWGYHYFTHVHHKSWSYALMFLRYGTWRLQFSLFFLGYFLPFQQPNNPENQNFEKMKWTRGVIIILHKCTINYNHMMYGSWDIKCDGFNFDFWFWDIFTLLSP